MISFSLSDEQEMVRETARKFAVEELRPRLRQLEKGGIPDELRRRFHELGVSLIDVPEAAGGMGLGATTAALVHEELAFGDPGAAVALWGPHLATAAVVELGSPEQVARLLAPFAAPDGALRRGAVAWSETGKDLPFAGMATRARRDGEAWILDGRKAFVIHAGDADLTIVFAQIGDGWDGVGAFAVTGRERMRAGAASRWLGLEPVRAGELILDGVRVDEADRLACDVARLRRFFARAWITTAARQVGLARAAYETALAYTQDRVAFGKPVAHFQAVSFDLAEMHMEVESARWMVWRAAAELDAAAPSAVEAAAKALAHANQAAWRVADDAVQLHGGAGYIKDFPVEKWLRDTKTLALIGGSDALAQLVVAGIGFGLPESIVQPVVT